MSEVKQEKILFKYHSNILDELTVEAMWAKVIDKDNGIFKLDNIPFYGPLIATDDEFYAKFDESEQMLTYQKTTKYSGNSIVLVIITQDGFDKETIRNQFKELNCTSEVLNDSYFSMEILRNVDYFEIKKALVEYEKVGIIEFAEPYLSKKHREDIKNN